MESFLTGVGIGIGFYSITLIYMGIAFIANRYISYRKVKAVKNALAKYTDIANTFSNKDI